MKTTEEVALEFSRQLIENLGISAMTEAIIKNRTGTDGSCATHDYCDANMVMLVALADLGLEEDGDEYWNAAWSLAKENEFYLGKLIREA